MSKHDRNRRRQRAARLLAQQEGISYQAAVQRLRGADAAQASSRSPGPEATTLLALDFSAGCSAHAERMLSVAEQLHARPGNVDVVLFSSRLHRLDVTRAVAIDVRSGDELDALAVPHQGTRPDLIEQYARSLPRYPDQVLVVTDGHLAFTDPASDPLRERWTFLQVGMSDEPFVVERADLHSHFPDGCATGPITDLDVRVDGFYVYVEDLDGLKEHSERFVSLARARAFTGLGVLCFSADGVDYEPVTRQSAELEAGLGKTKAADHVRRLSAPPAPADPVPPAVSGTPATRPFADALGADVVVEGVTSPGALSAGDAYAAGRWYEQRRALQAQLELIAAATDGERRRLTAELLSAGDLDADAAQLGVDLRQTLTFADLAGLPACVTVLRPGETVELSVHGMLTNDGELCGAGWGWVTLTEIAEYGHGIDTDPERWTGDPEQVAAQMRLAELLIDGTLREEIADELEQFPAPGRER